MEVTTMTITIIGKRHCKGTSKKTGNPFDFLELHYNGRDKFGQVEGYVGKSFTMNPAMYPYDKIVVGETYEVEFDSEGVCSGFCEA